MGMNSTKFLGKKHGTLSRAVWVAGVLSAVGWSFVFGFLRIVPLERLDFALRDALVQVLPPAPTHPDLMFVTLDEGAFDLSQLEPEEIDASVALTRMQDTFPWSREVYAEMLERLLEAGARQVVLDIHFPSARAGDEAVAGVVSRFPGRVVFASLIDRRTEVDGSISVSLMPSSDSLGWRDAAASGYVNFWPDADSVVRRVDYRTTPSEAKQEAPIPGEREFSSLSAVALRQAGLGGVVPEESRILRFAKPGSFPRVPMWQLFVDATWDQNTNSGEIFNDKIIVFGATAARLHDFFRTPVKSNLPGAELHLNAINAALNSAFFWELPTVWGMGFIALCGLVAALPFIGTYRPDVRLAMSLGVVVAYVGAVVAAGWTASLLLPLLPSLAALLTTTACGFGVRFTEERAQRVRVRRVLERYVSRDIVREVLDAPDSFLTELGGSRKDAVVLFSDLRGFTALSESLAPDDLVAQLNEYLSAMVPVVFRHGGTIDKFMGDAIIAVWGTVGSRGRNEDGCHAIDAALEMLRTLDTLNAGWVAQGHPPLSMGIGLHAGDVIFGNIGAAERMELTVIGDTVNLASRLEGACKPYGLPLLFSASVASRLAAADAVLVPVEILRVKGRSEAAEIFTHAQMLWPEDPGSVRTFREAILAYRDRRFDEAAGMLATVDDGTPAAAVLLQRYRERCRHLVETPPAPDWSPIVVADSK